MESVSPENWKPFSVVVAIEKNNGIGKDGTLPWPMLKKDLAHLARTTTSTKPMAQSSSLIASKMTLPTSGIVFQQQPTNDGIKNAIIMGKLTYLSIPKERRPLKNRLNVVLTSNPQEITDEGVVTFTSFEIAMTELSKSDSVNELFVIGGASLINEAMTKYLAWCKLIFLTRISQEFDCDVKIDPVDQTNFPIIHVSNTMRESKITYDYVIHGNKDMLQKSPDLIPTRIMQEIKPHPELQYLDAIRDIISTGQVKGDRTGTGIITKFGYQFKFDLAESFPMLTTKDVYWKGVVEELLWFIKGDTNAKHLSEKKVRIWDGNGSREFLDKMGFTEREEGDLGPVYGFQWRHFGAAYKTMHDNYESQGFDQLAEVINLIKHNPESRRIVMSAWNAADLKNMALPPCHVMAQFYVSADGKLSCQMYQRSCDMGLGIPFNIASYSLMTCMLAQVCGLQRGEFIHVLGDAHVYSNHVYPLKEQLQRVPYAFPWLEINPEVTDIEGFQYSDFKLVGYKSHPKIKMDMAV